MTEEEFVAMKPGDVARYGEGTARWRVKEHRGHEVHFVLVGAEADLATVMVKKAAHMWNRAEP